MLSMIRPRKAVKGLEMGGGGDKMEYFFAASLAIVIIGALALTIYFTFLRKQSATAGPVKNMWKCQKCGTEFSVDENTQHRLEEMTRPVAECPKCGALEPVWPMVRCPACGKYYVRQSIMEPRRYRIDDDHCPYCGKNWVQAMEEQGRARKK
jgi:DNA-directed RNA polymerase subunit RPC12/RpoP